MSNPQTAGVKRLGGFRPMNSLATSGHCDIPSTGSNNTEDDDDYEPDPKIRARKEWRKQYDEMKKRVITQFVFIRSCNYLLH